jgi:hypothetical protein
MQRPVATIDLEERTRAPHKRDRVSSDADAGTSRSAIPRAPMASSNRKQVSPVARFSESS